MQHGSFLESQSQVSHAPLSGNGGITRMDILFGPTPDAIEGVSAAILSISTNIPCSTDAWDEAEKALRQAMTDASIRAAGNGRSKVRCQVSVCDGRTTVDLLGPDKERRSASLMRSQQAFMVYSDTGCSIWLVDDL